MEAGSRRVHAAVRAVAAAELRASRALLDVRLVLLQLLLWWVLVRLESMDLSWQHCRTPGSNASTEHSRRD
jgi:hypothetical protein